MNIREATDTPALSLATPLHLELLIAAQRGVQQMPNWASMATQEYAQEMVRAQLIEVSDYDPDTRTPMGWAIAPRGRAWLSMLVATPLPVPAFVDPRTSEALS